MASGYTWPIEWGNDEYCQNLHPHADCGNGMYWGWNGEFCTCKDYFDMPNWLFKGPVLYDNIGVNSGGQCYNALTWFDYEPGDDCYSADASLSCTNECTVDWDSATQDMWSPESCCMIQYQSNPPYDVSNWQALMPDPVNDCSGIPNPSSQKYNCLQKSTGGPNTSGPIHSGGGGGLGMKPNPRRGIRSHHKGGRGRSRNASKRGRLIRR
jgi:hypothetical protein